MTETTTTAPAPKALTEDQARKLTEQIKAQGKRTRDALTKLVDLVNRARNGEAHTVLKYASWTAYVADVLSGVDGEPVGPLTREDRKVFADFLFAQGMSTRAVAQSLGVSKGTAANLAKDAARPERTEGKDGKSHAARKATPARKATKSAQATTSTTRPADPVHLAETMREAYDHTTDEWLGALTKALQGADAATQAKARKAATASIDETITRLQEIRRTLSAAPKAAKVAA